MTTEFHLPNLGEDIESGDVLSILVSEGDEVEAEQGVLELETDKATVEVPCPVGGRVAKIHVSEGQTVPVGALLLTIDESQSPKSNSQAADAAPSDQEEAATDLQDEFSMPAASATTNEPAPGNPAPQESAPSKAKDSSPSVTTGSSMGIAESTTRAGNESPDSGKWAARKSSAVSATSTKEEPDIPGVGHSSAPAGPAVRRLARELGVDLQRVTPTGEGNRLTREDVLAYVRQTTKKAAGPRTDSPEADLEVDNWGTFRRESLSKIRRTIAEKMTESYTTIPQLTNFDDADVTELEKIRLSSKEEYARRGIKLTSLTFIVKAVATSLRSHPLINASLDVEAGQIIYKNYINIGIAVDTERGLVVPVMRDVNQMSIQQIAAALASLSENTRQDQFTLDDLRGSTFTISNLGAIGGSYSTPLINPPNVAILLSGRARMLPAVVEDRIEPRLMLPLSLTYDHRIVDGAAAARFLNDVKNFLEAPARLLIAP